MSQAALVHPPMSFWRRTSCARAANLSRRASELLGKDSTFIASSPLSLGAVYTPLLRYVKYKLDLLQEFGLLAILKAKRCREYIGYEQGREVLREHAGSDRHAP